MDTEPVEAAKAIIGEKEPQEVGLARAIAREAHVGQVDKLGVDYFQHPEAVAKRFEEKGEWDRAANVFRTELAAPLPPTVRVKDFLSTTTHLPKARIASSVAWPL